MYLQYVSCQQPVLVPLPHSFQGQQRFHTAAAVGSRWRPQCGPADYDETSNKHPVGILFQPIVPLEWELLGGGLIRGVGVGGAYAVLTIE